jgi:hypothetical protein
MKLIYRGTTYDYNPKIAKVDEAKFGSKYCGLYPQFNNSNNSLQFQSPVELIYQCLQKT